MNYRFIIIGLFLGLTFQLIIFNCSAQLGISSDGSHPDASSILDVKSTSLGLLMPRMTTVQRDSIQIKCSCTPANGLMIYNITTACFEVYYGGVWSSLACACTAVPSVPTTNAGSGIQATQFTANWLAATGATTYYIDVATDIGFTSFVSGFNNKNTGNVTGENVPGLTCNTTYYYRVRASNACGTTGNSSIITVTTASATGPTAASASGIQQTQFTSNWGSIGGATTYYLDVATDATFTAYVTGYVNLNLGLVTSANVTGLVCGTTYYYRVRAGTSCGPSSNSNTVSVNTLSSPAVTTATSATSIQQTQFSANWDSVANATTYFLDVATDAGFTSFVPGYNGLSVGATKTYNVTGLVCNTVYYYRVRAGSGCGASGNSNTISTTTCVCNPVTTAASGIESAVFNANWTITSGATTYYLDVSANIGFTSYVSGYNNLNVGNVLTFPVTGISCNNAYYYRVRAGGACGSSGNSNTTFVTTTSTTTPTSIASTLTFQTQFNANWNNIIGTTAYYLDVATDAGFTSFVTGYNNLNVGAVLTYVVGGLTCNTPYYSRVRASNGCGTGGNSNTITTTSCMCTPVTIAATSINTYQFNANWNTVTSATTYYLDVATDVGFTSFVTGYNNLNVGNVLTYNVTGLSCNTPYYYRVRAGGSCTSVNSNTTTATTTAISVPTATAASGFNGTSFSANWTSSSGSNYLLDVATDNLFASILPAYNNLNVGNVTTYPVTGLTCGATTYYYRVRMVNTCGTSGNSNVISTATVPVYSIPITLSNSQASATATNFQQKITVNSSTYSSYESTGLENVEFTTGTGATGTQLQAWIESGATNSSVSTVYWVNLGSSTVPASGTLTIYMNFMATNVMSSSGPTGEAPTLSGTYGQYDNGASVFGIYHNFAGSTVNSSIFTSVIPGAGTTITQNNGVTIATNASTTYGGLIYTSGYSSSPAQVFDGSITAVSGVAAGLALQVGATGNSNSIDFNYWSGSVATGTMASGMASQNNPNLLIATGIMGGAWLTTATQVWYKNYVATAGTQNIGALPGTIYPSIGIYYSSANSSITYKWIRTHLYAPSGVMPTPGLGTVTCN